MDEIILEVTRLVVMVFTFAVGTYLIPWIKQKIGTEKMSTLITYVERTVYAAQQLLWDHDGADRREYATSLITEWCEDHNVDVTEEQIRVLLEAAVKGMKIAEGSADDNK